MLACLTLALAAGLPGCDKSLDPTAKPRPTRLATGEPAPPPVGDVASMTVIILDRGYARDLDRDGAGDLLRIGVWLFESKPAERNAGLPVGKDVFRGVWGDGDLVIRLMQQRPDPLGGPPRLVETYAWRLGRDEALESVRLTQVGYQYRLALTWPNQPLSGEGALFVEFHSASGRVVRGERKPVKLYPETRTQGY